MMNAMLVAARASEAGAARKGGAVLVVVRMLVVARQAGAVR